MDEILAQITKQAEVAPDSYFWYALSLLLASALIIIIYKYADKVQKTLDGLVKMVAIHENDIKHMKDDIAELKATVNTSKRRGQ